MLSSIFTLSLMLLMVLSPLLIPVAVTVAPVLSRLRRANGSGLGRSSRGAESISSSAAA